MKDLIKEIKFEKARYDFFRYTQFMCSKCRFFKNNKCTKNRIQRICAKKGLKNKE